MSNNTHPQSKVGQNNKKAPGAPETKGAVDNSSIQLLAYQIYQEKGGSELDNWLEAERSLKNDHA